MTDTGYREELPDDNEPTVGHTEVIVCEGVGFKEECFEFNCPHQNGGQCWRM